MSLNTMFFAGIIVALLMVSRVMAAMSQRRSPIPALFLLICGLVMICIPVISEPENFTWTTFPDMVIQKIGNFLN